MAWLRNIFAKETRAAALRAVPQIRRQKNYSALSGYAYEYFYEGLRDVPERREHVFTVSGDRKSWFAVSVFVPGAGVEAWQRAHGRVLADNERYAIAKMALFEAFDTRDNPQAMQTAVEVSAEQIEDLLARLDVE